MRPTLIAFLLFLAYGCKQESGCTKFGSENYNPEAVVDDGSCIHIKDKFLGLFDVASDCFNEQEQLLIAETSDDYIVTISNLGDTLPPISANVYGDNITIDRQSVGIGVTVEGAGVYTDEAAISLSYRIRDSRNGTVMITDCLDWCVKVE